MNIGTAMVRRRVIADENRRYGVDTTFQREAIRGARWISTVILIAAGAYIVIALVFAL